MFNFFKKKKLEAPVVVAPVCTCGSWPDATWTFEDFIKKNEAIRLCPVHKSLQPVMVVNKVVDIEPQAPVTFNFDQEIRAARIHIVQAQQALGYLSNHDLMEELELMQDAIEGMIEDRKI